MFMSTLRNGIELDFTQAITLFTDSLALLNQLISTPGQDFTTRIFTQTKTRNITQSVDLHNTVEDTVCLNAKTSTFQAHLGSELLLSRPFEKGELQQYIQKISVICAFDRTSEDLTAEIGEELTRGLFTIRDINPEAILIPSSKGMKKIKHKFLLCRR
ncbi:hypothetical protein Glove_362g5 [Diversispora epigaea]|uniref:Uncharacterized protein n=1 Tax=Diversispora epigaea TaxID=1348612 RepID=A0A397H9B2_9GLOM|nr:hypothetical protein Glove_362g5 [Diversispora epigaea]